MEPARRWQLFNWEVRIWLAGLDFEVGKGVLNLVIFGDFRFDVNQVVVNINRCCNQYG